MVTRGLIDEAVDTWKALATVAVSPAVPRPPRGPGSPIPAAQRKHFPLGPALGTVGRTDP